jgi:hypothetical protein
LSVLFISSDFVYVIALLTLLSAALISNTMTTLVAEQTSEIGILTTPRPEGRGFRGSRPGVPVSQPTAKGVSLAV